MALLLAGPVVAQTSVGAINDHDHSGSRKGGQTLSAVRARSVQYTTNGTTTPALGVNPNTQYANNIVKAWASWDYSTLALLDSFNISSVTALGALYWRVNFSTPFASVNYAVTLTGTDSYQCGLVSGTKQVTSVDVVCVDNANSPVGVPFDLVALGRQASLTSVNASTVTSVQAHTHASSAEGGASISPQFATVTSTFGVTGAASVGGLLTAAGGTNNTGQFTVSVGSVTAYRSSSNLPHFRGVFGAQSYETQGDSAGDAYGVKVKVNGTQALVAEANGGVMIGAAPAANAAADNGLYVQGGVDVSTLTVRGATSFGGAARLAAKTIAQLQAITPSVGDLYRCTDCLVPNSVVTGTGTSAGNFGVIPPLEFQ